EGYNQPLWIRSSREPRSRYGDLAESIAYWLWQCTDGLAPLLEPMGSEPIVFTLGESDSFFSTTIANPTDPDQPPIQFSIEIQTKAIELTFGASLASILLKRDNVGDRLLVDQLLQALSELKNACGLGTIPEVVRSSLIDNCAPRGLKKKLHVFSLDRYPELTE